MLSLGHSPFSLYTRRELNHCRTDRVFYRSWFFIKNYHTTAKMKLFNPSFWKNLFDHAKLLSKIVYVFYCFENDRLSSPHRWLHSFGIKNSNLSIKLTDENIIIKSTNSLLNQIEFSHKLTFLSHTLRLLTKDVKRKYPLKPIQYRFYTLDLRRCLKLCSIVLNKEHYGLYPI